MNESIVLIVVLWLGYEVFEGGRVFFCVDIVNL